jgi:hypothetical protein
VTFLTRTRSALPAYWARLLACAAVLGVVVLFSRGARAQTATVDGAWTMTPITETFKVQKWGKACGAQPTSGSSSPGGPVTLRSDGREIAIDMGRRTLRSDQCVDPLPSLTRDSHTAAADGKSWRTHCVTAHGDSRQASVNAAYFLTGDDTLSIAETGRYETVLEGAHCVVDVSRQASLKRALPAVAEAASASAPSATTETRAPAATAPSVASTPRVDCSSPGDPARLEVRPSRKLLRLGEDFAFQAIVVDADGCRTPTPVRWSLGSAHTEDGHSVATQASIDPTGKLSVPADGPAEAAFDVIATAASRSARASVQVASPALFDALLAQSGLNSKGERDEPSVTSLATTSLGTSNVRAEDGARRRRAVFISIVTGLALVLGVVAIFGARRTARVRALELAAKALHADQMADYERRKREREEQHAREMHAHLESVARAQQVAAEAAARGQAVAGARFCPSCHREFSAVTEYCPFDSNRLVPVAGHEALVAGPSGGICPTCRRGFNPGVRICPNDGDELVPPALLPPQAPAARGKICPTCGDRFDGAATFCGKDGTQLVLLN